MRQIFAIALIAGSLAVGAASMSAQANEALATGADLSTTHPRDTTPGTSDRLAYDVDFKGARPVPGMFTG